MTTYSRLVAIASVIAGLMLFSARVSGQVVEFRDPQNDSADEPAVQLKLRGNVDLRAFVDYVGQRLNLSFIYDDEIAVKRINVRAPDEVPVRSLLELLGSVLKMEGLILVDADTPGWLRIIDKSEMPRHIQSERPSDANPAAPVTHMFTLENADPQSVLPLIRDFLTDAGGTVVAVSETGTLIVTDYSSVIDNLATIIRMLDQGRGATQVKYYRVQHASVSELVMKAGEALNSRNVKLVGVE